MLAFTLYTASFTPSVPLLYIRVCSMFAFPFVVSHRCRCLPLILSQLDFGISALCVHTECVHYTNMFGDYCAIYVQDPKL